MICNTMDLGGLSGFPVDEAAANARLIASAPDLLAALTNLRNVCQRSRRYIVLNEDGFDAYNATAEAIQKADSVLDAIRRAEGGTP